MSYQRAVKCDECHAVAPISGEGGRIPPSWWGLTPPQSQRPHEPIVPLHFCDEGCLADYADRLCVTRAGGRLSDAAAEPGVPASEVP